MNISNLYRQLKQILDDSNTALVNRGFSKVSSLSEIPVELERQGGINRLPYLFNKEIVEITESDFGNATTILSYAFYNCKNLTSIVIPKNVTKIQDSTFWGCAALESVKFPQNTGRKSLSDSTVWILPGMERTSITAWALPLQRLS